jgi:hydroxyethylthiazole kinase
LELLDCKPTVVRGNAGEVMALAGSAGNTRGVDSTADVKDAKSAAKELATQHRCVVAVSGEVDYVRPSPCAVSIAAPPTIVAVGLDCWGITVE